MDKKNLGLVIAIVVIIVIAIVLGSFFRKEEVLYKVTFDYNYKTEVIEVNENDVITKPINPEREGYIFTGWYYKDELYDFTTKITKNITIVAKWKINDNTEKIKYTITFDTDSDTVIEPLKVLKGKRFQL